MRVNKELNKFVRGHVDRCQKCDIEYVVCLGISNTLYTSDLNVIDYKKYAHYNGNSTYKTACIIRQTNYGSCIIEFPYEGVMEKIEVYPQHIKQIKFKNVSYK